MAKFLLLISTTPSTFKAFSPEDHQALRETRELEPQARRGRPATRRPQAHRRRRQVHDAEGQPYFGR